MDEIEALKTEVRELQSQLTFAYLCYAHLHYTYQDLLRRVYGSRTQKLKTVLKNLGDGEADELSAVTSGQSAAAPAPDGAPAKKPRKHGGGGRRTAPSHLPIVREVIDLPEAQKAGLEWIRDEITNQLAYRPSLFYLHRIVRPVYASRAREQAPILAPLPPQVIPQAGVHVSFIAHTVIAKFADHIPYYRQEAIDVRGAVFVARQARYRYAMAAANLLMTIREGLKQMLLAGGYIHIDETFADLIDPDRAGRVRTCYLWGYLSVKLKACVMEFSLSRSGDILEEFFKDASFEGAIHSDGARMYTRFIKKHPHIRHHLCMQHVRKYLIDALKANERQALPLLQQIGELYAIEDEAGKQGLTDPQRGYFRHAKAKPILKRLQRRFLELKQDPALFGNLRKAVIYATNRWREIALYAKVDNSHILIDNNRLEALWRPVKVNQKNSLFIGHPAAGWVSAVLYSIMATCRLLNLNPEQYLIWVLPKLAAAKGSKAYQGLLPHDFARLQTEQASQAASAQVRTTSLSCTTHRARAERCNPRPPARLNTGINHGASAARSAAPTQTRAPPR